MKFRPAYHCHSTPWCFAVTLTRTHDLHCFNMAYLRNVDWKEDDDLKNDLKKYYVKEDLKRNKILDFLKRDYSQYAWSLSSLDRRMRYFDVHYTDRNVTVEQVREALTKEVGGPGKLLGYRAMQKKLRQEHELKVPLTWSTQSCRTWIPKDYRQGVTLETQNKRKKADIPPKAQILFTR